MKTDKQSNIQASKRLVQDLGFGIGAGLVSTLVFTALILIVKLIVTIISTSKCSDTGTGNSYLIVNFIVSAFIILVSIMPTLLMTIFRTKKFGISSGLITFLSAALWVFAVMFIIIVFNIRFENILANFPPTVGCV